MSDLSKIMPALDAALALLPGGLDTPAARVLLLAIGLQESGFEHRRQFVGKPPRPIGPAKSFWQAEIGGGMVRGVRLHPATAGAVGALCRARGVLSDDAAIWNAIEHDDVLAAGLARLLLWSDPQRLPAVGDVEGAWALYLRTWRPGAWSRGDSAARAELRAKWGRSYAQALEAVQ